MEKTIEVVKFIPQERVQNRTVRQIIDVQVPRVMEETVEVETLKLQRSKGESTLLADNKFASKLDGGCAVQAPEWEELQMLRDEELVTIHDINKLLKDSDSHELFKEILPSPSMMQVQSDKSGVACRACAVVRNSSGSSRVNLIPLALNSKRVDVGKVIFMTEDVVSLFQQEQDDNDNKKTSCLIDISKTEDGDMSLAIDTKSHASAFADPTEQQQQSTRQEMQQQMGERVREGRPGEEREKGRNDEGGRGQKGKRKEKERETEGHERRDGLDSRDKKPEAKEDGPDLRQGEWVQGDPDGGESDKRQSRRCDEADPERRGRVCDDARESAEDNRKAEELRSYRWMQDSSHAAGCEEEEDTRTRRKGVKRSTPRARRGVSKRARKNQRATKVQL